MEALVKVDRESSFLRMPSRISKNRISKLRETEMANISKPRASNEIQKPLMNDIEPAPEHYLPLMLKIYRTGKLSSILREADFINVNVKFSEPRGMGL